MSRLALLAALALAAAAPGAAKTLPKVPPALNPAKAYILVEYKLLKNPFGNFPGSRKTMPLKTGLAFGRYDPALGDIRGMGKARANPVPAGQAPIEGFRYKPVAKGPATRLMLIEVDPGTWVVQGFGTTSFSLGSYAFELAPGTVTDLGIVEAEPDWAEGQDPPEMSDVFKAGLAGPFGKSADIAPMRAVFRPRAGGDIPLPAGIPADKVRPVAFIPGAKFGNYLGGLVNKIEGVNAGLRKPHWTSSTNR
ncbi:MAG TPA: hypothetical protein VFP12_06195 [Allosphingosinicella sp.]|nr:hypothetical protein [Allosphingosinicella sp.]